MTRSTWHAGMSVLMATAIGCGEPASTPRPDADANTAAAVSGPAAADAAALTKGPASKLSPAPLAETRPID